jgi:hypothetical protein
MTNEHGGSRPFAPPLTSDVERLAVLVVMTDEPEDTRFDLRRDAWMTSAGRNKS